MRLAIFDFDHTITRKDSLIDFIYHTAGPLQFTIGAFYLSPLLILHKLNVVSAGKTKEIVLNHFFNNYSQEKFTGLASLYSEQHLPAIVRESALQKIHWHQDQGHKIVVVSASLENYLLGFCRHINADLLATELEFKEGLFTGKLKTPNCKGQEKIRRLQEHYDLKKFEYIYAYGDSPSDSTQKSIANEFHYRSFQ
jgi:phosphatidylglycerophosphatase C